MSHQYAVRRNPLLLSFAFLFAGWLVLVGLRVIEVIPFWTAVKTPGQGFAAGLLGLVVIVVALGLLVALYGELAESGPTPTRFPPEQ